MAILAAVDGDRRRDRVVEVGLDFAAAYDEDLVVLYVMPQAEFDRRRENQEYYADDATDDATDTARWVVEGTLDDPDVAASKGRVGEPVDEILAEADLSDARYLVVGGRKRTPVGKAIFGSVTQSLLLGADLPVVTVLGEEP